MNSRNLLISVVLTAALLGAGCSERNPIYSGDLGGQTGDSQVTDGGTPPEDRGPGKDGITPVPDRAVPDNGLLPDSLPDPDSMPWSCTQNGDCDDGVSCTKDTCTPQKTCTNVILGGFCLINKTCYKTGDTEPQNPCSVCAPTSAKLTWSAKANGLACTSDGISCTVDACQAGRCTHLPSANSCLINNTCVDALKPNPKNDCEFCQPNLSQFAWSARQDGASCANDGLSCTAGVCQKSVCVLKVTSGCLINKTCVKDGAVNPQNACEECDPKVSTTAYTYTGGKPCSASSGVAGFCAAKKCRSWHSYTFRGSNQTDETILRTVEYTPADKRVWAGGQYEERVSGQNVDLGILVDVAKAASGASGASVKVSHTVRDIHGRVAVGHDGAGMYHDGKTWVTTKLLPTVFGTADRYSVWSRTSGNNEVYYFGGVAEKGVAALLSCTWAAGVPATSGGTYNCVNQSGIAQNMPVAFIHGDLSASGGQGPIWAAIDGDNTPEDIYYNPGSGSAFSLKLPEGCDDGNPASACDDTANETYHFAGAGSNDLWLTGSRGMIIHYDGSKWSKISNAISNQSAYSVSAVYPWPSEKLVIFALQRTSWGGTYVYVLVYNTAQKKWYGPTQIRRSGYGSNDWIYDIDGAAPDNLWMVGRRRVGSGSSARTDGWLLQFK